ncbi:DNA-directed RNA polymerase subunit delta [Companilactobacillus nantensis]|uniref:Probable DNA-directed RNA polymerase subunit delta n=1 Tax=Companilactobacillus nantensis DSM 16982 TaxID=1423774 RepID=A0A0R1WDR2_9LACO|nr:DNA-directed RNA polymerase subunit delta [Companilactobacillus nantensis]KRM15653.1 DNA-directed RNA polymerase subunit delta [Companilactobacillus nantensis DSM 16982]GEO64610.1 putative DNA-directed RNA polymerase subunit delta [Companilactobacillus nantensis]
MKFDKFKDQNKDELSLIEVAYEILNNNNKEVMNFSDIVNEIQDYLGKSDDKIKEALPQFYTDLNNDGSFLSLGENVWGLRKWYPYDSVDEEVNHPEDNGTENTHKAAQKVNAFLSDDDEDDDVVDYDDDSDLSVSDMDDDDDESDGSSDNGPDLSKFTNSDLTSVDDDDDDEHDDSLEDGIEGQLSEFDADDDDEDIDLSDDDDDDEDDDIDDDDEDSNK